MDAVMAGLVDNAFVTMQASLDQGAKGKSRGKGKVKGSAALRRALAGPPTAIQSRLDKEVALHIGPNRSAINAADEQVAVDAMLRPTLTASIEKGGAVAPLHPSQRQRDKAKKQARALNDNTGEKWFNMPATKVTPEILTELRLMKMRHVFDPKHFMKQDKTKIAKYFQFGTEVDNPLDHYANRGLKKKKSMVDELLADATLRKYQKKRFREIQGAKAEKSRGKWKKSTKPGGKAGRRK